MPTIVISYRRNDSKQIAGRIFDRLEAHYGKRRVFMDIDAIPVGLDFRDHIRTILDECDILLAIIGPAWLGGGGGKNEPTRIEHEDDYVRIEVETALKRGIPVVPLLIDGTPMPKPEELPKDLSTLVFRNAALLDTGVNFHNDMNRVIASLDEQLGPRGNPLSEITRKFLAAKTATDLKRVKNELDVFLDENPRNTGARDLRDRVEGALEYEHGRVAQSIGPTTPPPPRGGRGIHRGYTIAAAAALVAIAAPIVFYVDMERTGSPPSVSRPAAAPPSQQTPLQQAPTPQKSPAPIPLGNAKIFIPGFEVRDNTNLQGSGLGSAPPTSLVKEIAECAQRCQGVAICAGFSFHKVEQSDGRHYCYLYGAPVNPVADGSWTSAIRTK